MYCRFLCLISCILILTGIVRAQDGRWICDEHAFEHDMSAFLTLADESGKMLELSKYEVAAFVDNECRGVAQIEKNENGSEYLYIRIRSNKRSGETVSFKCYSLLSGRIYSIEDTIEFKERTYVGFPSSPYRLTRQTPEFQVVVNVVGEGYVTGAGFYKEDEPVTLIATPSKGWRFNAWSNGIVSDTCEFIAKKDTALTAEFLINKYVVTFYDEDGKSVIKQETLDYGSKILVPIAPVKEGFTFAGWGDVEECVPAHDVSYIAAYRRNVYKVTYKVDGEVYATDSISYGDEIVMCEDPAKEGHTFSGWSDAPATMPAGDVVIEGSFAVNTYNVIYKVDGEEYKVVPVVYGSEIVVIEAPIKEGHTFSGWSEAPATMPAEDVVIEGTFTVNNYTVTYLVDGEVYAAESVAYGTEIILIDAPVKEGHTFSGWSEAPATMPANDVTIEGLFAVNTYNVIYKVDGEEYKVIPLAYGSEIILIETPVKEGHTFSGWSEAPMTMPAEDVVIEGTFTVNNYTVTYFVDGEVYATETVAYGSAITLLEEPTKEGYTFSGWSEAPATMPAEDIVIEGSFSPITTINGVVYDAEDLLIYNLRGERIIDVDELERGIYIINGKKVWVK